MDHEILSGDMKPRGDTDTAPPQQKHCKVFKKKTKTSNQIKKYRINSG